MKLEGPSVFVQWLEIEGPKKERWVNCRVVRGERNNGAECGSGATLTSRPHQLGGTPAHRRGDGVPSPNPPGPAGPVDDQLTRSTPVYHTYLIAVRTTWLHLISPPRPRYATRFCCCACWPGSALFLYFICIYVYSSIIVHVRVFSSTYMLPPHATGVL